jgi:hypothetical protein
MLRVLPFTLLWLGASCIAAADFPLKVGPTGRYLVDQGGKPFLIHGDSPWSIIVGVTKEDADVYFADRRAKGVNALIVNLVEHLFNGPVNRYGDGPFLTPGDFGRPNEKYFDHADWVLRRAAENGMLVLLNPLYLGYKLTDEGWYQEAILNGPFKAREYGRWVGRRYSRFKNIIWVMGGDRKPDMAREVVDALTAGIRETAPGHLFTAHAEPEYSAMDEYAYVGLDLNGTYTYNILHKKLLNDYNRRPVMPGFLFESSYENMRNASEVQIRRQLYWPVLCGASGHFFGNEPVWGFDPGWKAALESKGAREMVHVKRFFESIPWHDLEPDAAHRVVTGGLGEFNGMDYLSAACTRDRRLLAAYAPTKREIEVDSSQIEGARLAGWWFDPRTGLTQPIAEFAKGGKVKLSPPSDGDFALVLHDSALGIQPPSR